MPGQDDLEPLSDALQIDSVCDAFEDAWRAGKTPRIEDRLAECTAADRPRLLAELLKIELELRSRDGAAFTEAEYARRFAGYESVVAVCLVAGRRHVSAAVNDNPLPPGTPRRANRWFEGALLL